MGSTGHSWLKWAARACFVHGLLESAYPDMCRCWGVASQFGLYLYDVLPFCFLASGFPMVLRTLVGCSSLLCPGLLESACLGGFPVAFQTQVGCSSLFGPEMLESACPDMCLSWGVASQFAT